MAKDFKEWHELKSVLEKDGRRVFFHEREVWFSSLGFNLGYEQDGKGAKFLRPVIVLKKFNQDIFWGIPMTGTIKPYPYYYELSVNGNKVSAVVSQLRLIDRKRLFRKVGMISEEDFERIKQRVIDLLGSNKQIPSQGGDLQLPCQPPEAEAIVPPL